LAEKERGQKRMRDDKRRAIRGGREMVSVGQKGIERNREEKQEQTETGRNREEQRETESNREEHRGKERNMEKQRGTERNL
jgi:hypothetical protein